MKPKNNRRTTMAIGSAGVGEISREDVERRAREIAMIDGRGVHEVTDEDRARARAELTDASLPPTTAEDRDSPLSASRDPAEPVGDHGSLHEPTPDLEGQEAVERLVLGGVREAEHEQMVSERRRREEDRE